MRVNIPGTLMASDLILKFGNSSITLPLTRPNELDSDNELVLSCVLKWALLIELFANCTPRDLH